MNDVDATLQLLLAISAGVMTSTEILKVWIKSIARQYGAGEDIQKAIIQIVAIVFSIVAVFALGGSANVLDMFFTSPVQNDFYISRGFDLLLTGILVGLGSRAMHWFADIAYGYRRLQDAKIDTQKDTRSETVSHTVTSGTPMSAQAINPMPDMLQELEDALTPLSDQLANLYMMLRAREFSPASESLIEHGDSTVTSNYDTVTTTDAISGDTVTTTSNETIWNNSEKKDTKPKTGSDTDEVAG